MLKIATTYIPTLLLLLAIDSIWIGFVALPMFRATLGQDMLEFRAAPGILFYLIYAAGLLIFVLPAAQPGGWPSALVYGALFGLVTYGTYDLTNYATLKLWSLKLAAADIVWGMVLAAVVSALGMLAGQALLRRLAG